MQQREGIGWPKSSTLPGRPKSSNPVTPPPESAPPLVRDLEPCEDQVSRRIAAAGPRFLLARVRSPEPNALRAVRQPRAEARELGQRIVRSRRGPATHAKPPHARGI